MAARSSRLVVGQQPECDRVAAPNQLHLLRDDHQGVGPGEVAEQARAVTADELDLSLSLLAHADEPAGELSPPSDRGDVMGCAAGDLGADVRAAPHEPAD